MTHVHYTPMQMLFGLGTQSSREKDRVTSPKSTCILGRRLGTQVSW